MRLKHLAYSLLLLPLYFSSLLAEPKYFPKDKAELLKLLKDENIKLNEIDTSKITDMSYLFCQSNWMQCKDSAKDRKDFSGIDSWDVGNVENMRAMFVNAKTFNQPLNSWNVSKVKNMGYMFANAIIFNQPLDKWNVGNVENMEGMFFGATSFNQPLQNWNVANLKWKYYMFYGATSFAQSLKTWGDKAPKNEGFSYGYYGFFEAIEWIGFDEERAKQYFTSAISKSKIYNLREDAKAYLSYILFSQNPNSPQAQALFKEYLQTRCREDGIRGSKPCQQPFSNDISVIFWDWEIIDPRFIEDYNTEAKRKDYATDRASHLSRILALPNTYKLHGLEGYSDIHTHGSMGAKDMFWPLDIHPREFFANPDFNSDWFDLWCKDGFIDGRSYISVSLTGATLRVYFDWIYPIILQNPDLKQAYEDIVIATQEYYKEVLGVDEQTANDFGRMRTEFQILDSIYNY